MPIQVSWGNEQKTYTVFRFEGKWSWDEYHRSIADAYELVKDIPYTVNILLDITECHLFPQNLLSHVGSSMKQPPKSFDLAVVATSSRFVEVVARTVEKLYGRQKTRFQVTRTLEEAHNVFSEHDRLHPITTTPTTVTPAPEAASAPEVSESPSDAGM